MLVYHEWSRSCFPSIVVVVVVVRSCLLPEGDNCNRPRKVVTSRQLYECLMAIIVDRCQDPANARSENSKKAVEVSRAKFCQRDRAILNPDSLDAFEFSLLELSQRPFYYINIRGSAR